MVHRHTPLLALSEERLLQVQLPASTIFLEAIHYYIALHITVLAAIKPFGNMKMGILDLVFQREELSGEDLWPFSFRFPISSWLTQC